MFYQSSHTPTNRPPPRLRLQNPDLFKHIVSQPFARRALVANAEEFDDERYAYDEDDDAGDDDDIPAGDDGDVVALTAATFSQAVSDHKHVMVEFYAPWCGHCRALAPEYREAAATPKELGVLFAKVDATKETELADKYNVDGYPTVLFATDGEFQPFGAGRTSAEIVRWVKRKLGMGVTPFNSACSRVLPLPAPPPPPLLLLLSRWCSAEIVRWVKRKLGMGVTALAPADIPKVPALLESAAAAAVAFVSSLDAPEAAAFGDAARDTDGVDFFVTTHADVAAAFGLPAGEPPTLAVVKEEERLVVFASSGWSFVTSSRHHLLEVSKAIDRGTEAAGNRKHHSGEVRIGAPRHSDCQLQFGPYFIEPVIAGLEDDGTPFICATDLIGAYEECPEFGVAGTADESLFGACESYWQPGLQPEELFETISQALLAAVDRDALSGWGATVHVITLDKIITRTLKGRMD
ncbi:unnamed protein product [Closterium sp. Yama58-4]|nr:unnamed protein product [Closterium sp. Yama58-4]